MRALDDVSWLLPVCFGSHEHHAAAVRWMEGLQGGSVIVVCRFAQLGLIRLLNNPIIMGDDVCSADEAWDVNDRLLGNPRFRFEPEPSGLEEEMRALTQGFATSPKLWQDAYLAAFAIAAGLHLVTFDKGFKKRGRLRCIVLE